MGKSNWADLSQFQRRVVVAGALAQVALQLAALRDLRHRAPEQVNGPRWVWVGATFVNFVGPCAYFLIGRRHDR